MYNKRNPFNIPRDIFTYAKYYSTGVIFWFGVRPPLVCAMDITMHYCEYGDINVFKIHIEIKVPMSEENTSIAAPVRIKCKFLI